MGKVKKLISLGLGMIVISLTITSCTVKTSNDVIKESNGLKHFKEKHSDAKVMKHKDCDLNGDGLEDTIIIFNHTKNSKKEVAFTVELGVKDGYEDLGHFKAPLDNQSIEIKDTDGKPPTEFVISGSKNGEVGLGIYRVENNKLIDIFGTGSMDAC